MLTKDTWLPTEEELTVTEVRQIVGQIARQIVRQ